MAKLSTLTDAFPGTSLNAVNWFLEPDAPTGNPSGTITVSGGKLSLSGGAYADTSYYTSVDSNSAYDLTGSYAFVRILPNTSSSDYDTGLALLDHGIVNGIAIGVSGGNLYVQETVSGAYNTVHTVTYDATAHAWVRISESGGTITFSAAPDGSTWTTVYTTTTETINTWSATSCVVQMYYGSVSGAASPAGTAGFEDFNTSPGGGSPSATPTLLGCYVANGAFPGAPASWPPGPATNLAATYVAWDQDVGTYVTPFLAECNSNGLLPYVELEPWHAGASFNVTPLFSAITGGTYDTWLEAIGSAIAATGKTVILTFAHEFNVSGQYPWAQGMTGSGPGGGTLTAAEWIAGWTYVKNKVNSTAAGYAKWMWACNSYTGGTTVDPTPWWPSSALPDYVGIDGYPSTTYGASLGTFTGQFGPTVTIIRGLGWTNPIFISETNLAAMVSSGGESITAFVADMYAAGMSGILEFEEYYEPDMTSAQWAAYNGAIAEYYGTPGGGGGGGTASGLVQQTSGATTGTSLTLAFPAAVAAGDTVVVCVAGYYDGTVSAITLGGSAAGTWAHVASAGGTGGNNGNIYANYGVTTSSATLVITTSAAGIIAYAYEVAGVCCLDTASGNTGSGTSWTSDATGTTIPYPHFAVGLGSVIANTGSITPTASGWTSGTAHTDVVGAAGHAIGAVSGYAQPTGSGTYAYSGTSSASSAWGAVTAAFLCVPPPAQVQTGWGGMVFDEHAAVGYTGISATFTIPDVTGGAYDSVWIGLGNVYQTGLYQTYSTGHPGDSLTRPWSQWVPGAGEAWNAADYPTAAGDTITLAIQLTGTDWLMTIANVTESWTYTQVKSVLQVNVGNIANAGAGPPVWPFPLGTAEVIIEREGGELPSYETVAFSSITTTPPATQDPYPIFTANANIDQYPGPFTLAGGVGSFSMNWNAYS